MSERIDMRDLEKLLELMRQGKTLEEIRREMFEFCRDNGVIIIEDGEVEV